METKQEILPASTVSHTVATGLSAGEKVVHVAGQHLPGSIKAIALSAEVVSECLHNPCEDSVEQVVVGFTSASTQLAAAPCSLQHYFLQASL